MIRKILTWTGISLGSLLLLGLAWYGWASFKVGKRMQQKYTVAVQPLTIPSDSAGLLRGHHLAAIKGCTECHGDNLAGKVFLEDPMIGRIPATNLTKGRGGLPAGYGTTDWLRALKHGLRPDGTPLVLMPSHEFAHLSEQDMGALIQFCQSLPAVDNELPPVELKPLARVLTHLDQFPLLPAEKIDHSLPLPQMVALQVGTDYGKYLAVSCIGCHHESMKGGPSPVPGFPPVPDITSSGSTGERTEEQFIQTLRTGLTPDGRQIKSEEMPWQMTAKYSDDELRSLYLSTL
jgi:cytochrome c553